MSRASAKKKDAKPAPPSPVAGQTLVPVARAPRYVPPAGRPVAPPLGAPPAVPRVAPPKPTAWRPTARVAVPVPDVAAAAAPQAHAPAAPASPSPAPTPVGYESSTHATNAYAERLHEKRVREWQSAKQVPQGEVLLVHAWANACTELPPESMTVWLRRIEPEPGYDLMIPGNALTASDWPDRKLHDEVQRRRRQPTVLERFTGRIRARFNDGNTVDVGCGEISLPPEPGQTNQPAWVGAAPVLPYGVPPFGPGGYPPPYGAPAGPYGGPPPPYGMPPMPPYLAAAYGWPWGQSGPNAQAQTTGGRESMLEKLLVEAIQNGRGNPETLVSLYRAMSEGQNGNREALAAENKMLLQMLLEDRRASQQQQSNSGGSGASVLDQLTRMAQFVDTLRGNNNTPARGMTMHEIPGGGTLVESADGQIDTTSSALINGLPMVRDLLGKIVRPGAAPIRGGGGRPMEAAAPAGPGPAKPPPPKPTAALNGSNGAAKNGTHA